MSDNSTKNWVIEIMAVLAIPAIAYSMGIAYEIGYASYFDIPVSLIRYDVVSIYLVFKKLVIAIIVALIFVGLIRSFFDKEAPYIWYFELVFWFIGVLLAAFLVCPNCWMQLLVLFATFLLIILVFVIAPLFPLKDKTSYREKVGRQLRAEVTTQESYPHNSLIKLIGGPSIWNTVLFTFIFGTYLAWLAGHASALNRIQYPVLNTNEKLVVLRIYDEIMITAPLNQESKEFEKEFIIFKVAQENANSFRIEKIGPLKPVKPKQSPNIEKEINLKPKTKK